MKNIIILNLFLSIFLIACKGEKKEDTAEKNIVKTEYASFGEKITTENSLNKEDIYKKFQKLQEGDTLEVKFNSTINSVCKKKGCWMKLDLGKEQESMVRFKDYAFFMPLNSENKKVFVHGKAYVKITPVEELQHYAMDAGKSEAEIAKITEPKYTYAFEADGVLLEK